MILEWSLLLVEDFVLTSDTAGWSTADGINVVHATRDGS